MTCTPWSIQPAPVPHNRSHVRIVDGNKRWIDLGSMKVLDNIAPELVMRVNAYSKMLRALNEIKSCKLLQCNCPVSCDGSCTFALVNDALVGQ